jgi:hypothetical protein
MSEILAHCPLRYSILGNFLQGLELIGPKIVHSLVDVGVVSRYGTTSIME